MVYASKLGELLTGTPLPAPALAMAKDSVGAAIEVANQAGAQAGPASGAAVKGAVDAAFVDGFHAGSWISAAVVLLGAVVAYLWLPERADVGPLSDAAAAPHLTHELASSQGSAQGSR